MAIKTHYESAKDKKSFNIKNVFKYNVGDRKRIWELDILRGILMIFVTLDHVCYFGLSLGIFNFTTEFGEMVYDLASTYCNSAFRIGIQPFGLFLFCYLSGINYSLTKSKFRRVAKMWIVAGVFMGGYAILHLIMPEFITGYLIFNIIAVIAICVTVWWLFDLMKIPTWIRFAVSVAIICVGLTYYFMYFVRDFAYFNNDFLALLVYNIRGYELSTNNFEPLFPHLGWFILGGVMGKYIYKERKTLTKHEEPYKAFVPIAYVGKYSLAVYVLGTVIILALILAVREIVHAII